MSIFRCFRRKERGNVATIFALALVPLLGIVGAAIDFGHVSEVRAKLADALDADVLAVGSHPNVSDEAYKIINDWVTAHLGEKYAKYWRLDSVILGEDGSIQANATGSVDTTLARILGYDHMDIEITSQAIRSLGKVEVALVLDNTGSMKGTKPTKLKGAALVDSLVKATGDHEDLKMGLVPFSMTVNVGPQYRNASWMDNNAVSPIHDEIFIGNYNRFAGFNKVGKEWAGCVESRPYPYDVGETEPTASIPGSLYVPYFAPDEPDPPSRRSNGDFGTFYNNDLPDSALRKTNWKIPQGDTKKYNNGKPIEGRNRHTGYEYGPKAGCDLIPLVRLTSNTEAINKAIKAMTAVGDTNIPMGLAWGWNVLSPNGPFGDGVEYDDPEWKKVVVLMTDGQNENTATGNDNRLLLFRCRIHLGRIESEWAPAAARPSDDRRLTTVSPNSARI